MSKTTIPTGGITDGTIASGDIADDAITDDKVGTLTKIGFNATQSASSDANTLDDYEEGDFTPTIGSLSLAAATGKYTKIGRAVSVQGYVSMGSQSGGTTVIVSGFPFQPASNSYLDVTGDYSNQNPQALRMQGGTSNASLVSKTNHSDNNNSDYNYNDMNGKYFYFHGVYFV
tara:strand:+ start:9 stop:527 length:519 start_codon:yes stop_codon:yes gene_type:complete